jgi:pimeloyl-ACP methyl ester carboxylesterase
VTVLDGNARRIGGFRTDGMQRRFLDAYETAFRRLWPGREESDVDTRFGPTHVHRHGRGPHAVVLLNPARGVAAGWHRSVVALGQRYTVYAVDTLGDAGFSVQERAITGATDSAAWLDDVLTGLDLDRVHLVGCSYGGWLALNQAVRSPRRLASITLLDPVGFARIGPRFQLWHALSALAALGVPGLRRRLHHGALVEPELLRAVLAGVTGFRPRLPRVRVLHDWELRAVLTPTLLLLGENSALHNARRVLLRARALIPSVRGEIVTGAGHDVLLARPEFTNSRILDFLATCEPA